METMEPILPFRLPAALAAAIVSHAHSGTPEEVCGIVRGRGLTALEIIPARNVAEERIDNYTVDPQTLLLQFAFEDAGDEMVAIYHSHPVSPAYPSATDAWNAHYPDALYIICSLEFPQAPVLRGWRLETVETPLDWDTVAASLPFVEVRPGLFGYYQPAGDEPATGGTNAAAAIDIAPPWYLVYQRNESGTADGRLVSVREVPLEA